MQGQHHLHQSQTDKQDSTFLQTPRSCQCHIHLRLALNHQEKKQMALSRKETDLVFVCFVLEVQ